MTGTRAVIAAAGVALVLGVAACSGSDPEPRVAPSSSSPPSTTAAADPIPPTMPPEAKGTDAAAAEAFVKFYWEMVNYAQETGDLDGLTEISSGHCAACKAGIGFLAKVYDRDGAVSGGESEASHLETVFLDGKEPRKAVVEFDLTSSRQLIDYPGKHDDVVYKGGTAHLRAVLNPTDSSWIMAYWGKQ